jgi:hypothetical protein
MKYVGCIRIETLLLQTCIRIQLLLTAQGERHDGAALYAAGATVQVFNGGLGVFEFGHFQEASTAPVLAAMDFAVNQQR